MKSKQFTYLLLLVGATLSIYAQWRDEIDKVTAAVGIVLLMYGLFRLSKGIKGDKPEERYIFEEDEEE